MTVETATVTKKGWIREQYEDAGGGLKWRWKWGRKKLPSAKLPIPKISDPDVVLNSGQMRAAGDNTLDD